jgi:histidinol-phosphate phosphatase family protein
MSILVTSRPRPGVVLLGRDGILVEEVPYNTDPARVRPLPGVAAALDRLRRCGVRIGVLTYQSGLSRGLVSRSGLRRVHRRIEDLLGRFDLWQVCAHEPSAGCGCRRPEPGLIEEATQRLRIPAERCVVVGDRCADMSAAGAVGASGLLVPSVATRPEEISGAPAVATDLPAAVDWVLGGSFAGVSRPGLGGALRAELGGR